MTTSPPPAELSRAALLDSLARAVQAQAADPVGVDFLSIDVLAAAQRLNAWDGAAPVLPEHDGGFAYVGRRPCGCVRAATVDTRRDRARVARDVAEMITAGLVVERVPVDVVRATFGRCGQCDPPRPSQAGLPL